MWAIVSMNRTRLNQLHKSIPRSLPLLRQHQRHHPPRHRLVQQRQQMQFDCNNGCWVVVTLAAELNGW
jgi:hypothetical protein